MGNAVESWIRWTLALIGLLITLFLLTVGKAYAQEGGSIEEMAQCNVTYAKVRLGISEDSMGFYDGVYQEGDGPFEVWAFYNFTKTAPSGDDLTDWYGYPIPLVVDFSDTPDPLTKMPMNADVWLYNSKGLLAIFTAGGYPEYYGFCQAPTVDLKWSVELTEAGHLALTFPYPHELGTTTVYVAERELTPDEIYAAKFQNPIGYELGWWGTSSSSHGYYSVLDEGGETVEMIWKVPASPEYFQLPTGIQIPLNKEVVIHTDGIDFSGEWARYILYRDDYGLHQITWENVPTPEQFIPRLWVNSAPMRAE